MSRVIVTVGELGRKCRQRCVPNITGRSFSEMKIAVLIKQVPAVSELAMGEDGRILRDGIASEMNPYCRRALSKGLSMVEEYGGTCLVFTFGPTSALEVLLEALSAGANWGYHITDPSFRGSDTLATSKIIGRALEKLGPFDIVLTGRNSIDSDTSQVPPQIAQDLKLPFLMSAKELTLRGNQVFAYLEDDEGYSEVSVDLPVVISAAERLCEPTKVPKELFDPTSHSKVTVLGAEELGFFEKEVPSSMTAVVGTKVHSSIRMRKRLIGSVDEISMELASELYERGAFRSIVARSGSPDLVKNSLVSESSQDDSCEDDWDEFSFAFDDMNLDTQQSQDYVAVLIPGGFVEQSRALTARAGEVATSFGASLVAFVVGNVTPREISQINADEVFLLKGGFAPLECAQYLSQWMSQHPTRALLALSTTATTETLARVGVIGSYGMIGDCIDLEVTNGRIIGHKPAFGGSTIALIEALSPTTLATLRPALRALGTAPRRIAKRHVVESKGLSSIVFGVRSHLDDYGVLENAPIIIGVGAGVEGGDYLSLDPVIDLLGASIGASRRVTDKGLMPRTRQIGITGSFVSPDLYMAIGISGKLNHMIGVVGADTIVGINPNPSAPIFDHCDFSVVADFRVMMPALYREFSRVLMEGPL
ncbi:acryloyl-CoA reductase electron transfer subunit gamma [Acidithrix ferrooxidans]|uniref:Electron transfer flavoprotein small subunit n=2 Tax=Acidithrix ferrooxidans TaxID=1280514 RepID=A0A0D8HIM8_9ACTN|nr:acryloyl-CoA reductase electron transfer subunit gamma [Acidithrix ferrooxidans]